MKSEFVIRTVLTVLSMLIIAYAFYERVEYGSASLLTMILFIPSILYFLSTLGLTYVGMTNEIEKSRSKIRQKI